MSFAQSLSTRAGVATRDYAAQIVQKFKAECEAAAYRGGTSRAIRQQVREGWLDLEQVTKLIKEEVGKMGFDSYKVHSSVDLNNDYCLQVEASWKHVAENRDEVSDPGGSTSTCPICHEDQPVVALVPCGHVVCRQCQGQLRQCPMCRIELTGATRALFLS